MLGGPLYIALIRFVLSLAGTFLLFNMLSEPRFDKKRTVACYAGFSVFVIAAACVWYVADWESCVKMVVFVMFMCFSVFSIWLSSDPLYLSLYKLALTFYLLAVFLVMGIEVAVIFFDRNVWADIIVRILLIGLIALLIHKYVRQSMQEFGTYVEREADTFSVAVMIICILFGIGYILNPGLSKEMTPHRIYQVVTNFLLTGTLQLLVFHFYLHIGKEKEYEREKQLIQMNYSLWNQAGGSAMMQDITMLS